MPRLNIYIPVMKLKRIDLYCKEKGVSRSNFLVDSAMSFINSRPSNQIRCGFQGCRNLAIGNYELTIYDWQQGETKKTMHLCNFHFSRAKTEGQIKEV